MNNCECGCGQVVTSAGKRFIHGHHAKGRKKSAEEKAKIGKKNSENMKRYMKEHPEVAALKVIQLRSTWTEEKEKARIDAMRLRYSSMTAEDKQKFSVNAKRLWSEGILNEDTCRRQGETFKQRIKAGLYDLDARNEKISKTVTRLYLEGGFTWSKGTYTSTKTGCVCYYRSSWELQLMYLLDADERVEKWNYEFMCIKYELNGKVRRYVPDFHVVSKVEPKNLLIEVKPIALTQTVTNIAKRDAAITYCAENSWVYREWQPGADYLK